MRPKILTVGHVCLDVVHSVPQLPTLDRKIDSDYSRLQLGGNAANSARAIIQMGGFAEVCSVLGDKTDPVTMMISDLLLSSSMLARFRNIEGVASPISSIMLLPDGSRAISNHTDRILSESLADIGSIDFNMCLGDTHRIPLVRSVFEVATIQGIPTMLDVDKPVPSIDDLPKSTQTWFSQESWVAMELFKIGLPDVQKQLGGVVGITDGENPIRWIQDDGIVRFFEPTSTAPINTLGAGDVFRASLALNVCLGKRIEDAIEAACSSACEHITGKTLKKIIGEMS